MKVAPAIAALRDDPVPQRQAQTAMGAAWEGWLADSGAGVILDELDAFGEGERLEKCAALDQLFTGQGTAEKLVHDLAGRFCAVMRDNPLAHAPFRHGFNGHSSTMMLARSGRARLLLQAREPGTYEYPSATFTDSLRYEAVLAGEAKGCIMRISGAGKTVHISDEDVSLRRGSRLAFDCHNETLLVTRASTRLVSLRLEQLAATPGPGREYCRRTGKLLHQAAGSLAISRKEMMISLLGRMGRKDAAPVIARFAFGRGDKSLRWQALRECIALDTARGFAALSGIARDSGDPLAEPAGALRAQLVEAYPQLLEMGRS